MCAAQALKQIFGPARASPEQVQSWEWALMVGGVAVSLSMSWDDGGLSCDCDGHCPACGR